MPDKELMMELSREIEVALAKILRKFAKANQDALTTDAIRATAVGVHMALVGTKMGDLGCKVISELLEDLLLVHAGHHELYETICRNN